MLALGKSEARIMDWRAGKRRLYGPGFQANFYTMAVFALFPDVQRITAMFAAVRAASPARPWEGLVGARSFHGGRRTVRPAAWALAAAVQSSSLAGAAWAAERVAPVIGNAACEHTDALKNPGNDAADMAEKLGSPGFEVVLGKDFDGFYDNLGDFDDAFARAKKRLHTGSGYREHMARGGRHASEARALPEEVTKPEWAPGEKFRDCPECREDGGGACGELPDGLAGVGVGPE